MDGFCITLGKWVKGKVQLLYLLSVGCTLVDEKGEISPVVLKRITTLAF
jgi:hypothetical protein